MSPNFYNKQDIFYVNTRSRILEFIIGGKKKKKKQSPDFLKNFNMSEVFGGGGGSVFNAFKYSF
jgi:hypothetical protein